jgi:hypothetical protein
MRAKYINKTARRRTVRPDGDEYRALRRLRGKRRRSGTMGALTAVAVVGVLVAGYLLFR